VSNLISIDAMWPRIISVADDISLTLLRTSFSPDIRENFDYGCVVTDRSGRMLAHGWPSATGHITAMGRLVKDVVAQGLNKDMEPGDVYIGNDPWLGSGHTADVYVITPIFQADRHVGFAMSIVHHLDVGGRPNSPESRSVYEEGLRIPLLKIVRAGRLNQDLVEVIRTNVRFSERVIADIKAQIAANEAGAVRFRDLLTRFGLRDLDEVGEELFKRTEVGMRRAIAKIPDGTYRSEVNIDDTDRFGNPLWLRVAVEVAGDSIVVDFTGSSKQVDRAINCPLCFTSSYAVVALKFVTDPSLPFNDGAYRPISFRAEEATIANAKFPAATYWRGGVGLLVPDVIIRAMSPAVPHLLPASCGSLPVWLFTVSGFRTNGDPFLLHSHCFGGIGGRPNADGLASTGFPYNIQDVPTEVFENDTPIMCVRRELLADSGGPGKFRGGLGERVTLRAVPGRIDRSHPIVLTGMFGRTKNGAPGVFGGAPGAIGALQVNGVSTGNRANQEIQFEVDDDMTLLLPGGGGYGPPSERDPRALARDLELGYVTSKAAADAYPGVKPAPRP
jgi:N-methylhydantoinase B